MTSTRRGPTLAVLFVVAVGLATFVATRFRLSSSVSYFLPKGENADEAAVIDALASSPSTRTSIVLVRGRTLDASVRAARNLTGRLRRLRETEHVHAGTDSTFESDIHRLYFPRRYAFLVRPGDSVDAALTRAALRTRARALRDALTGPAGPLYRQLATSDPFLAFPAVLERARATADRGMATHDGAFVSADRTSAVLFVRSAASGFDARAQRAIRAAIDSFAIAENVHVRVGGVPAIALATEGVIRKDIELVSTISMIGVVILFLVVFRSLRALAAATLALGMGTLSAVAVTLGVFGALHGLTLAFGAAIIGVAIDYVEHLVNHHALAPDARGPFGTLERVWPGLRLGALTTVAGLAGLGLTSYPGIREIAVFSAVGVAGAAITTRYVVPHVLEERPSATVVHLWLARALTAAYGGAGQRRVLLGMIPLTAAVTIIAGLPQVVWNDDPALMTNVPEHVLASDAGVRRAIDARDSDTLAAVVVRHGASSRSREVALELALAKNERVAAVLRGMRAERAIGGFRSVADMLPSTRTQRETAASIAAHRELPLAFVEALAEEDFIPEAFTPFASAFRRELVTTPLTHDMVRRSALGRLLDGLVLVGPHAVVVLSPLEDVDPGTMLEERIRGAGGLLLNRKRSLIVAYARFRTRTLELTGVGLALVFLLCLVRYRNARLAFAACLPAVFACALTVALLALFGEAMNMLHVVAMLLVLSMGVDYGIFVVESRESSIDLSATLTSLCVAMLTTVLSFGLLGLSSNPALRAIGLTTALGVTTSMLLAPAASLLLVDRKRP